MRDPYDYVEAGQGAPEPVECWCGDMFCGHDGGQAVDEPDLPQGRDHYLERELER